MELVKPDGKLYSGVECLYQLPNGSFLFSECAREEGDAYVFDAKKTCVVIIQGQAAGGGVAYGLVRMDQDLFAPTTLRVPKSSLLMVRDTTDAGLLKTARGVLSGIVVAGPGAAVPPGERVN